MNSIAMEYPGYGIYKGKPCDKQIEKDALTIFDFLVSCGVKDEKIMVIGRSLGSGPATFLASRRNVGALVLISPFKSVRSVAHDVASYASILVKERFNNKKLIQKVECPTLLIHGKADNIIGYHHSVHLEKCCKSKSKELRLPELMTHTNFDLKIDLMRPMADFLEKNKIFPKELPPEEKIDSDKIRRGGKVH
jgi:abhydrolase domain-containing protein 17